MLTKNTDLIIDPEDIYKNDCLDRKQNIIDLTNLVESTTQPFVLSVEAPWGWGKTTFVRLWKAYLEKEKHPCLYFNAWSNDFVDDPFIAFLSEMGSMLEKEKDEGEDQELKRALRKAQKIGGKILRKSIPIALRLGTQGMIDENTLAALNSSKNGIGEFFEQVAEGQIKAYEQTKQGVESFRKCLAEFAQLVLNDEDRKGPIVFFVDELDRCRPNYAMEMLERIKHVFNVDGVVFVISTDRQQLVNSVKTLYGEGIDAEGYLRRFFDLSYQLPAPTTVLFVSMLFEQYHLDKYFKERLSDHRYANDQYEHDSLLKSFIELARIFQFSLRVQEQCMIEINIVLRTTGSRYKIYPALLSFLVCLKSYRPDLYKLLHQEKSGSELILTQVKELLVGSKFIENEFEPLISSYLILHFCDNDNPCMVIQNLRTLVKNANGSDDQDREVKRAERILNKLDGNEYFDDHRAFSYTLSRLDNIGNFQK